MSGRDEILTGVPVKQTIVFDPLQPVDSGWLYLGKLGDSMAPAAKRMKIEPASQEELKDIEHEHELKKDFDDPLFGYVDDYECPATLPYDGGDSQAFWPYDDGGPEDELE